VVKGKRDSSLNEELIFLGAGWFFNPIAIFKLSQKQLLSWMCQRMVKGLSASREKQRSHNATSLERVIWFQIELLNTLEDSLLLINATKAHIAYEQYLCASQWI
jgi:hypothetical protein